MATTDLVQLLDTAERPRAGGWSLRSSLVRYAQPQPVRASAVLELVRRIEWALKPHVKKLEKDGRTAIAGDEQANGVLDALATVDDLGDALAAWAVDPGATDRPDATVDATVTDVARRLDEIGVPKEDGPPPRVPNGTRGRGRGNRARA
jgi:hypothetical protein